VEAYNQHEDDVLNFEALNLLRVEVSGIDNCGDDAHLEARVRAKVYQLRRGSSPIPGLAGVVAFDLARIRFRRP
jgi:hypothetical protein